MEKSNYWKEFWNNNNIIYKPSPHEKVGRTISGIPIKDELWNQVLSDLENTLCLKSTDSLLDIAAGSGVISIPFSKKVKSVTALDISEKLLNEIKGVDNIKTICTDAREIEFEESSFSKIILYFAVQHFNEKETIQLIQKAFKWLTNGGILFIGDIPDIARQFAFFNTNERQKAYFDSVVKENPIVGTWFQRDFFEKLGPYIGFSETQIIEQPESYINAHYRFDAKFTK